MGQKSRNIAIAGMIALIWACKNPSPEVENVSAEPADNRGVESSSARNRSEVGNLNLGAEIPALGNSVAELTPSECEELGGTVFYAPGCEGTLLGCRAAGPGRYARCIDERDPQTNRVE